MHRAEAAALMGEEARALNLTFGRRSRNMQATAYMHIIAKPKTKTGRGPARERLLKAAATVFGRDGLAGATTRGIAREAGVNEVTLFRLFGSKEKLLGAVVGQAFDVAQPVARPTLPKPAGNLRTDLANFARTYDSMLTENLPLIRALIGEIHHHREQAKKVANGIFRPLREEIIARLKEMPRGESLRADMPPAAAVDLLGGMILAGVLRRNSANCPKE
jgi:AcrR family transcriptional regulator